MSGIDIGAMRDEDFQDVIAIQTKLFTDDLHEDISILRRRCELYPDGCWSVTHEGQVVGYLVSNPWTLSCPPMLGAIIDSLPRSPDCVYLHDIGIAPNMSGRGVGRKVVTAFKDFVREQGFSTISLVAVMNTRRFWEKHGFSPAELDEDNRRQLAEHYGQDACYMSMRL